MRNEDEKKKPPVVGIENGGGEDLRERGWGIGNGEALPAPALCG